MESTPEPSRLLEGAAVLADPLVRELLEQRLVAVLATVGREGVPHLTPIWFADGGDAIVMATASASRKVRNLERDPRAALVLHDSRWGLDVCGASIEGRAAVVGSAGAAHLVERVHRRYVESDAVGLPEVAAFLASDDVALRFSPDRAWTWDQRQTAAAAELRSSGGALPLTPTSPRGSAEL